MIQTIFLAIYWWFIFLIISCVFYPLFKKFWHNSFDGGWIASKLIGILIVAYAAYILGILKLVKFSALEVWIILALFTVILRIFRFFKNNQNRGKGIEIDTRIIILEIFFLLMIVLMSVIRGFQPDIYGLEKYMDYGFVKSILEGSYFPPKDLWWAGSPINYYYFGHLWIATLIKLTGTDPAFGYNLAIASIFALSTTLIVVFVRTWTKNLWIGFLAAFIHSGIGNLHFITTVFKKGWTNYWYPDASRLIPGVITEFPVYSYVVYDLHAHVISIPLVILIIGFLGQIFRNKSYRYKDSIFLGFLLGVTFISNAWDLPIYLLLSVVVLVAFCVKNIKSKKSLFVLLQKIFLTIIVIAATVLPFFAYFTKIDSPILLTNFHSPIYMMFQQWGFWLILASSFFGFLVFRHRHIKYFDWFIFSLFLTAIILLIIPEFFYVKDIYGNDYQRANTVFKLTYQSWNIFAIAGAYAIWRILTIKIFGWKKVIKILWGFLIFVLIAFCFAYTVRAYISGYGEFKTFLGLNGERHIKRVYGNEELKAIEWIRKNTSSENVVLEAGGDSYTDYQRVSVNTGRPTVVGWAVHEWLWRGGYGPVAERQSDVEKIYTTNNSSEFELLIKKYQVKFIYLGGLEKQKYSITPGQAIRESTKEVYKNSSVTIYETKIE